MPLQSLKSILVLVLFGLVAGTAHAAVDCNAKLGSDRYYGAFYTLFKAGKLKAEDLAVALKSDVPHDPFEHVTPGSKNTAAKPFFAEAVRDEAVRTRWPQTKALLEDLWSESQGTKFIHEGAVKKTANILAPHEIFTFDYHGGHLVWTTLPDGQPVFARVEYEKVTVANDSRRSVEIHKAKAIRVETLEGKLLYRLLVPVENFSKWTLGWHTDQQGETWLYLMNGGLNDKQRIYRMNWKSKKLSEMEVPPVEDRWEKAWDGTSFRSFGNMYMILNGSRHVFFDVSDGIKARPFTPPAKKDSVAWESSPQHATLDGEGNFVQYDYKYGTVGIVFTNSLGNTYRISSDETDTVIEQIWSDHTPIRIKNKVQGGGQFAATETKDSKLLLARAGWHELTISSPLDSTEPIYQETFEDGAANFHWFTDHYGNTVLAFMGIEDFYFFYPADKSLYKIPRATNHQFVQWYSVGPELYFTTHSKDHWHIWKAYNEGK